MQYPPDPPRPEEIIVVMRQAGPDRHGLRVRALIAVLWRGGLRISEALALNETEIDERRGSLLIFVITVVGLRLFVAPRPRRAEHRDRRNEIGQQRCARQRVRRSAGVPPHREPLDSQRLRDRAHVVRAAGYRSTPVRV